MVRFIYLSANVNSSLFLLKVLRNMIIAVLLFSSSEAIAQPCLTADGGSGGYSCSLSYALNAVPGAGTGTWTMESGPGIASFFPDEYSADAVASVTQYGTYSFIWTEVLDTCTDSDTIVVTFYQAPFAEAGITTPAICQGGTTIALNGSFGGSAESAIWADGSAGGTFTNNGGTTPNLVTYTATPSSSSPVVLTLTTSGGLCGIASDSKSLVVNPNPTVTPGVFPEVCSGSAVAELPYTIVLNSPDKYSVTYNASAIAAGFENISDAPLAASPLMISIPPAAPPAVYGGSLMVSNSGTGCTSSGTNITITVKSLPSAPTGLSPQTFCSIDSPLLSELTAMGSNIQWYSSYTGGSPLSLTTPLVNNTHYFASQSLDGCESAARLDILVMVNDPAAPTGTSPQTFCSINTPTVANLSATGTSIQWYAASSGGTALNTSTALVNNTRYYATQTVGGCESDTRLEVLVNVNDPAAPTGTSPQTFCSINNPTVANLSATGMSIQWYAASSGGTALNTSTALVNNTRYYATQTVGGCESDTRLEVLVNVNDPAAPTGTSPQTFCSINNPTVANLSATGMSIQWYAASSGGTALNTSTALVNNTRYYATQTVGGCESDTRLEVLVNVNDPAAPTGTSPQTFCSINTPTVANLSATGTGIQWYAASTGGTALNTSTALVNNTRYYATQTVGGCESDTRLEVLVNVNDPDAPTGTSPQTFCSINTPTVANLSATGTDIQWYAASSGGTPLNTSTALVNNTRYYATQTVSGCESDTRLDVLVNVNDPDAPTGTSPQTFCSINIPTVANLSATGTSIQWYAASSGGTALNTSTALVNNNRYYATQTVSGCESDTRLDVLAIVSSPSAPVVGAITQPTCAVSTGSVGLSGLPSGTWTINPGAVSGSTSGTVISGLTTGTYHFTVTNSLGCLSPASPEVVINAQPPTPVISNKSIAIMTGGTFNITPDEAPIGTTYTWATPTYIGGVSGGSAQTVPQASISGTLTIPSGAGTATYAVTPTTGVCVGTTFTVIVTVTSSCVAVTIGSQPVDNSLCIPSGHASFTVTPNGTSPFAYQWQYNNNGTWVNAASNVPAGAAYTGSNASTINVSAIAAAGNYQYRCIISNCGGETTVISGIAILTVNLPPAAPTLGSVVQPSCAVSSGSVTISAPTGTGMTYSIDGINYANTSGIFTSVLPGSYTLSAKNIEGCISQGTSVTINTQPVTPSTPVVSLVQPTCTVSTGTITITSPTGTGLTYSIDGINYTNTTGIFTSVSPGNYSATAKSSAGCVSVSTPVVILSQPPTPSVPVIAITQPTCSVATGTITVNSPTGSGIKYSIDGISYLNSTGIFSSLIPGNYGVSAKNSSGCVSSTTNTVISPQPPTPYVPNQTASIATGGTFVVTPSGVPAGTTYTWTTPTYVGGVTGGSSQTIPQTAVSGTLTIPSGAGTATYTVTPVTGSCTGPLFAVTITVTSSCVAVTIGTQPINTSLCAVAGNATFTVIPNGTSPFTYQWQYDNGGIWMNVANGTPSGAVYSGATTGTLSVSAIISAGNYRFRCNISNCSAGIHVTSDVATLTVNALPVVPTVTLAHPTCAISTGTITIISPTGTGMTYSIDGASYTNTSGIFTYVLPGLYSVTAKSSAGCISPAANVAIYPQPVTPSAPTVVLAQPNCTVATGTITVTAPTGSGLTYSIDGVNYSNSTGLFTGVNPGSYAVTAKSSVGCVSNSTPAVINAQPPIPSITITNPSALCSPAKADITSPSIVTGSTPGLIYTYWNNAAATVPCASPSAVGTGTYYIMGTNNYSCFEIKPVTVTVNPSPNANAGNNGNSCNMSYSLAAIPSIGTGTWTQRSGPGTSGFAPDPNTCNAMVTVSRYGAYSYAWTEVSGSCSDTAIVLVNFFEKPVANAGIGGNNCGKSFILNAVPSVGTGTWTKSAGPGTATFTPDAHSPSAVVNVSLVGTYTFTWTEVNGTCSDNAMVTVNFLDIPGSDAGDGGEVCDTSFVLNAVLNSGSGIWNMFSGPGHATFSPDSASPDATVRVDSSGTYAFMWTVTQSECSSSDITEVVFHRMPFLYAGNDSVICKGNDILLRAEGSGTFIWTPGLLLNDSTVQSPLAFPEKSAVFKVSLTDENGCKNTDSLFIEVRPIPVAQAGTDQMLNYQVETDLHASIQIHEKGEWAILSGSGIFTDPSSPVSHVRNLSLNDNRFIWTVNNGVCPSASDTVVITVHDLVIPTLITPNMDGLNDYFVLRGIETLGKTELTIFNRQGVAVFINSSYHNDWNGIDRHGNPLPDDTYYFVLKAENGRSFSGYVVIKR